MECPRCGAKLGLLNPKKACATCGRPVCGKCAEWSGAEFHAARGKSGSYNEIDMELCSEDCAFGQYARFIRTIDPKTPLVLNDEGHVGLDVAVDSGEEVMTPTSIAFNLKRLDPRDHIKDASLAPEVRPLYDRVKRDLTEGRRAFREDYFGI